jgi:hypothetical protein
MWNNTVKLFKGKEFVIISVKLHKRKEFNIILVKFIKQFPECEMILEFY